MDEGRIIELVKGRKVLYIATKNRDYIRIQQEISLLEQYAETVKIISFQNVSYLSRVIAVYARLAVLPLREYEVVFVGFMPQMILPLWHWRFHHKIIIQDFFLSVYDTLVDDRRYFLPGTIPATLLHILDKRTLDYSDYIVADTCADADYFSEEFEIARSKLFVWYMKADSSVYFPVKHRKSRFFTVLYFGSVLPLQGVDIVLKAAELLKERKEIHFVLIGRIRDKYEAPVLDTITYIDILTQQELAQQIAASDLCLAGHFAVGIGKAQRTIPGKAYIYQAMEKKMILGDSAANRELFEEGSKVVFVERGNAQKLAEAILRQYHEFFS